MTRAAGPELGPHPVDTLHTTFDRTLRALGSPVACALLWTAATGCGSEAPPPAGPPRVAATTAMIGDVVTVLGAGQLEVRTLMGPGVDPHLYRPTREDMAVLLDAGLVLHNGLHLEGRMGEALAGLAGPGRRVAAFAELLGNEPPSGSSGGLGLFADPEAEGAFDPHAWMDPLRWARAAELVAPLLAELAPEARRAAFQRELLDTAVPSFRATAEALVDFGALCFGSVPQERRVLVTAHDAFRYFGERFGLEVHGLQGLSTESEAGLKRVEDLVELLVRRRIPAVFAESSVPSRAVEALIEGARARGHEVALGGELFADAMGAPGTPEGTYIGMLAHNIVVITRALGGSVPGGDFETWRAVRYGQMVHDGFDDAHAGGFLRPRAGGPLARALSAEREAAAGLAPSNGEAPR